MILTIADIPMSFITFGYLLFMDTPDYAQVVYGNIPFPVRAIECSALTIDALTENKIWGLITVVSRSTLWPTGIRFY